MTTLKTAPLTIWQSMGDYARHCRELDGTCYDFTQLGSSSKSDFYCGTTQPRTLAAACDYVERGATEEEQRETLALLDKIEATIHGRTRTSWEPSVCGAYPIVPDFLAGMPENMRHRVQVEHDLAPIRLVVQASVSAGVSFSLLAKRGAAVAALALRLAELRPVELWAAYTWAPNKPGQNPCINTPCRIKLDTTVFSVSGLVAALCSPQFARAMNFSSSMVQAGFPAHNRCHMCWFDNGSASSNIDKQRAALGMEPQDIFIPGGHLTEAESFARDPVAWVNSYLDPQREAQD